MEYRSGANATCLSSIMNPMKDAANRALTQGRLSGRLSGRFPGSDHTWYVFGFYLTIYLTFFGRLLDFEVLRILGRFSGRLLKGFSGRLTRHFRV